MAKPKFNIAKILSDINGATFAGIDYLGEQKVNKTMPNDDMVEVNGKTPKRIPNPQFGQISKSSSIHTMIGADYETMVKKHLAEQQVEELKLAEELREEGKINAAKAIEENAADPLDFKVGERKWGVHREDYTSIIEHKDSFYLALICLSNKGTTYYNGGQEIDKADVIGLPSSKPSAESQGGANKKVTYRTIGLDSITAIRVGGKSYVGEFYFDPDEV